MTASAIVPFGKPGNVFYRVEHLIAKRGRRLTMPNLEHTGQPRLSYFQVDEMHDSGDHPLTVAALARLGA